MLKSKFAISFKILKIGIWFIIRFFSPYHKGGGFMKNAPFGKPLVFATTKVILYFKRNIQLEKFFCNRKSFIKP
ncbi:hypothetical protein BACEGG_03125 [Bacteroides eggerthii DSM 20697]|nr:hypothetical protein BACEGG_03125 [Bacteroides eggerthii DSM 20697]